MTEIERIIDNTGLLHMCKDVQELAKAIEQYVKDNYVAKQDLPIAWLKSRGLPKEVK